MHVRKTNCLPFLALALFLSQSQWRWRRQMLHCIDHRHRLQRNWKSFTCINSKSCRQKVDSLIAPWLLLDYLSTCFSFLFLQNRIQLLKMNAKQILPSRLSSIEAIRRLWKWMHRVFQWEISPKSNHLDAKTLGGGEVLGGYTEGDKCASRDCPFNSDHVQKVSRLKMWIYRLHSHCCWCCCFATQENQITIVVIVFFLLLLLHNTNFLRSEHSMQTGVAQNKAKKSERKEVPKDIMQRNKSQYTHSQTGLVWSGLVAMQNSLITKTVYLFTLRTKLLTEYETHTTRTQWDNLQVLPTCETHTSTRHNLQFFFSTRKEHEIMPNLYTIPNDNQIWIDWRIVKNNSMHSNKPFRWNFLFNAKWSPIKSDVVHLCLCQG